MVTCTCPSVCVCVWIHKTKQQFQSSKQTRQHPSVIICIRLAAFTLRSSQHLCLPAPHTLSVLDADSCVSCHFILCYWNNTVTHVPLLMLPVNSRRLVLSVSCANLRAVFLLDVLLNYSQKDGVFKREWIGGTFCVWLPLVLTDTSFSHSFCTII
jgi:hypothetical protein